MTRAYYSKNMRAQKNTLNAHNDSRKVRWRRFHERGVGVGLMKEALASVS